MKKKKRKIKKNTDIDTKTITTRTEWKYNNDKTPLVYKEDTLYLITYEIPKTATAAFYLIIICHDGLYLDLNSDQELDYRNITRWIEIPEI